VVCVRGVCVCVCVVCVCLFYSPIEEDTIIVVWETASIAAWSRHVQTFFTRLHVEPSMGLCHQHYWLQYFYISLFTSHRDLLPPSSAGNRFLPAGRCHTNPEEYILTCHWQGKPHTHRKNYASSCVFYLFRIFVTWTILQTTVAEERNREAITEWNSKYCRQLKSNSSNSL